MDGKAQQRPRSAGGHESAHHELPGDRCSGLFFFICLIFIVLKSYYHVCLLFCVYFLLEGFKEAAEKFRLESGIEPSVDLDSLDERIKIREMILKGQIQEAIALINSLHPELLDTNRYLYFHLQVKNICVNYGNALSKHCRYIVIVKFASTMTEITAGFIIFLMFSLN